MDMPDTDGTADLRVGRAQVAMIVVRQRLVLRLLRQRVRDAVCHRALLGKQQGEDKKQWQEIAWVRHRGNLNKAPGARQALLWRAK